VALCQFLPGPASSQVGMAIGLSRAGTLGAILAWLGFTLPSAIILILFGLGLARIDISTYTPWIHGLKVVAVAIVAQAVLGMGKKLCPDYKRKIIAIVSCFLLILFQSAITQIIVLVMAAALGIFFLRSTAELPHEPLHQERKRSAVFFLVVFFGLLFFLPILREMLPHQGIKLFDSFYRAGSLVFGGGHVVLPMIQAEVVPTHWVSQDLFMAGYGLANAIPGPLFAFSAYLGAASSLNPNGWVGAILCLIAAFLPSFLLVVGVLPFWEQLRRIKKIQQSMLGINAGVVGMLLAALYNPVWINAIYDLKDFSFAALGFLLLEFAKFSSWSVVILTTIGMALSN
jgi:chromate transporter